MSKAVLAVIVAAALTGCAAGQGEVRGQRTDASVNLSQANYKIIKAGARGESSGFSLLGFIPLVAPSAADAKANLYSNVGVPLEGKAIALANQTEDRSMLYLILFGIPKVVISADVIEYNPKAE